jgi:hypothetical protein
VQDVASPRLKDPVGHGVAPEKVLVQKLPAGQEKGTAVHTADPEALVYPGGHAVQFAEPPRAENVLGGQAVHTTAPAALKKPREQSRHVGRPVEVRLRNLPGGHTVVVDVHRVPAAVPMEGVVLPAGHWVHEDATGWSL